MRYSRTSSVSWLWGRVLVLWLRVLCLVSSKDLFQTRAVQSQSQSRSEEPIHLATSIHGTHVHMSAVDEGQYVLTSPGNGRQEPPIEWVWQRPILNGRGHVLRGIVFLAHGCSHLATDFFPQSTACPKCIGLPEELRITNGFLHQQYAVVAVSSTGQCWGEMDFERTKRVLGILVGELGHGRGMDVPLYAVGASSGGSFVAHLPNYMPGFKAVVVQIMSVQAKSLLRGSGLDAYPPTLWIAMQRDDRTFRNVQKTVNYLTQHHKVAEVLEAKELPLHDHYLSDRIKNMTPEVSAAIVAALQSCDLLDEGRYLLQDPRVTEWRVCLRGSPSVWKSIVSLQDTLEADMSPISEELNVAYAMHELTGNHMSDMINFIMKYQ